MKIIAVDIDNVLNNFSATLAGSLFTHDDLYGLSAEEFSIYLDLVKRDVFPETEFLTSKFSDFRYRIHEQCYGMSQANQAGRQFMNWLKAKGWKIVICTKRNLRLTGKGTKRWLQANHIPYDYLFMAFNKIVFCKLWGVPYLIDDDILNIIHGEQYGIAVYYPVMPKHHSLPNPLAAKGFNHFEEIKQWLPK
jgi:5'(3')-deoxyribonucleotidase